jgi:hypothetical protein
LGHANKKGKEGTTRESLLSQSLKSSLKICLFLWHSPMCTGSIHFAKLLSFFCSSSAFYSRQSQLRTLEPWMNEKIIIFIMILITYLFIMFFTFTYVCAY